MTDLLGGRITMMFDSISTALPFVREGRVRALAVTTERPSDQLPGVPTLAQAGVKGYELTAVRRGGAGRDAARGDRSPQCRHRGLAAPARHAARLAQQGTVPFPSTPEQFGAYMRTQYEKWDGLIRSAHIRAD